MTFGESLTSFQPAIFLFGTSLMLDFEYMLRDDSPSAAALARDHSAWLGTTASRIGPVDRVRVTNWRLAGDRTQNLWFHKRIKLELELGLLIEIDLGSRAWIRIGDRLVRGSDSPSQLEQIPDHRDMDPQYATVDQLAEITDTMASLRDAILGLGQRIDGHQAQPLPIPGSTLHDSTTPPPPPPSGPSGPTIRRTT
ncbi:hypothetical protein CK203_019591 [Vitis vinifera]|uniref:Uncharacterized protein n=1 Tax=Vitis vinifera TaxID=29760 RepID=A0A438JQH6_VITVI|nr:hypothetical protein CK203_019591 [Vitis vinifera]